MIMTVIITVLMTIRVFPHLIVVLFVMTKLSIEVFDYMKQSIKESERLMQSTNGPI